MRQRQFLLPLLLTLVGCAEMRTPPPAAAPAGLAGRGGQPGEQVDPVRTAIVASAEAFADGGLSLAGKPDAVAQAAAQLEYLVSALPGMRAYAAMPDVTLRRLGLARTELRAALGIAEAAEPQAVMQALLAAARALRAGNPRDAAQALPARLFRPGGSASVRRFAEPGPLPETAAATALARQDLGWIDTNQLWLQGRPQDVIGMDIGQSPGGTAPGLGTGF